MPHQPTSHLAVQNILNPNAARFIQIHILLSSFAFNRNEDGRLKNIYFGGYLRTRRSSQSFKYDSRYCQDPEIGIATIDAGDGATPQTLPSRGHFEEVFHSLDDKEGDPRAKHNIVESLYETLVHKVNADRKRDDKLEKKALELGHLSEQLEAKKEEYNGLAAGKEKTTAAKAIAALEKRIDGAKSMLHKAGHDVDMNDEERSASESDNTYEKTAQVMGFSMVEIDLLKTLAADSLAKVVSEKIAVSDVSEVVKTVVKDWRKTKGKEFAKLRLGCGIQAAVFGRFAWGGGLTQSCPAAVCVQHQYTVHKESVTSDTFTARDNSRGEGDMGTTGILGELPLAHGLFYGYECIHTRQLIENIERTLKGSSISAEVVRRLILMASRLSTRTKEGSLAPKNTPMLILVEVGNMQPQSFGDAFFEPIGVDEHDPERSNMGYNAVNRLAEYIHENDLAHPTTNKRAMMLVEPHKTSMLSVVPTIMSDHDLAEWAIHAANGEEFTPKYVLAPAPASNETPEAPAQAAE